MNHQIAPSSSFGPSYRQSSDIRGNEDERMARYTLSQLAFVLTGPETLRRDGLCPVSWQYVFDKRRFDLALCWIELLPLLPLAILLLCGAVEAYGIRKLPSKRLSGWRGLGLYRLKLVRKTRQARWKARNGTKVRKLICITTGRTLLGCRCRALRYPNGHHHHLAHFLPPSIGCSARGSLGRLIALLVHRCGRISSCFTAPVPPFIFHLAFLLVVLYPHQPRYITHPNRPSFFPVFCL